MSCQWKNDRENIVLEVTEQKSTVDTELSRWRSLIQEFEEEGLTDLSVNGHELQRPAAGNPAGFLASLGWVGIPKVSNEFGNNFLLPELPGLRSSYGFLLLA